MGMPPKDKRSVVGIFLNGDATKGHKIGMFSDRDTPKGCTTRVFS